MDMNHFRVGWLSTLCFVSLMATGCSDQKQTGDRWYEESREQKQTKGDYIEFQVEHGVDPAEAGRQHGLNESIRRTWGREGVTGDGTDLMPAPE